MPRRLAADGLRSGGRNRNRPGGMAARASGVVGVVVESLRMQLAKKPRLVAAVAAAAVLAVGGIAFMAMSQPHAAPKSGEMAANGGPGGGPGGARGPGGPGGQRGPGGPGGGRGGGGGGGAPTQVDASPATPREFSTRIEALGTLEPKERVVLSANAADRVTGVFFEDGQRVAKGKVLMTLVNEEERAQLESAQATYANSRLVFERNQRLASGNAIAELELERSKSASEAAQGTVAQIQARLRDRVLV